MSGRPIVVKAPAKVNLFLGVGDLRGDGYHEVCTVMHAVQLADTVGLEPLDRPAEQPEVVVRGSIPCPPEQNLAWRAVAHAAASTGRTADVRITIDKRIPVGGGLGGGSSDAAAVLRGLSALWGEPDDEHLVALARELGSDVAFFLRGGVARYTGRGEVLDAVLPAVDLSLLLLQPAVSLSTAAVYRAFDESPIPPGAPDAVEAALEARDAKALGAALSNNLTEAATRLEAGVADALGWARTAPGVLGAGMTGSGSAVFAICRDDATARERAREAAARGWWSRATRTTRGGAAVTS